MPINPFKIVIILEIQNCKSVHIDLFLFLSLMHVFVERVYFASRAMAWLPEVLIFKNVTVENKLFKILQIRNQ